MLKIIEILIVTLAVITYILSFWHDNWELISDVNWLIRGFVSGNNLKYLQTNPISNYDAKRKFCFKVTN